MATIKVKAKPLSGFRRLGKKFTSEFSEAFEVSEKELAILRAEGNLLVQEVVAKQPSAPATERLSAKEMIVKVMTITDLAELKKLKKDEDRSTVLEAIDVQMEMLKG